MRCGIDDFALLYALDDIVRRSPSRVPLGTTASGSVSKKIGRDPSRMAWV
jgi:hypothetical protein